MPSLVSAQKWSFVAAALTLSIAGCGDAGPAEPGESTGRTAEDLFANDVTACNYFVGKGLTNFQAAGIVGNLDQESGVDPNAVQYGGGPGRGIAQWSTGGRWDTSSNDNAVWYAGKTGQSVWSLQLQLDFIWYELTSIGYGYSSLKATTNVTDATTVFQDKFEICGTCDATQRIAYAQAVLPHCVAAAAPAWGASFVSQSFPLATTTLTMVEGQVIPSYIELKNTGTKTWDSNTKIGTTQPRDRSSAFADSSWLAPNRAAAVKGTVAPGATYKFEFDLAAPDKAGDYDEFFGVVEEGVAWFSDSGQGGPPDNDLEVKITVVAAPPDAGAPADAGGPEDAGTAHDAGAASDAGAGAGGKGDAGSAAGEDGGGVAWGDDGGNGASGDTSTGAHAGCSVAAPPGESPPWASVSGLMLAVGAAGRLLERARRRRRR